MIVQRAAQLQHLAARLTAQGLTGALCEPSAHTHTSRRACRMIANPLQVRQLVVAVSHMDAVDFEEASFV